MYETFFGLQKNPFGMTPDPSFLFLTPAHREGISALVYAISERKGFVAITGEAGTGKTTLLSQVLRSVPDNLASFSLVLNPTLGPDEFLESVLIDFGIGNLRNSKVHRLLQLQDFLTAAYAQNRTCVLVVDEAQKLSRNVLEEIRLLSNFENADAKLLQIVLAGQPELRDVLNREDLRQLKQRIAVRFELKPLLMLQVDQYIRFRWSKAGGSDKLPFDEDAIQTIAHISKGIPRVINCLCDNALLAAFATGSARVEDGDVRQAMADLDLGQPIGIVQRTTRINAAPKFSETDFITSLPGVPTTAPEVNELRTFERYELEDPNELRLQRLAALGKIQKVTKLG
jgi:general secretion pathway protein A